MKKKLALLGVLLFLALPAKAEGEGDFTHHVCAAIAAGMPLVNSELIAEICGYVAWLEKKCQSQTADPESTKKVVPVEWTGDPIGGTVTGDDIPGVENGDPSILHYTSTSKLAANNELAKGAPQDVPANLFIFHYAQSNIYILEPMTPVNLGVRRDIGLIPPDGEMLSCRHKNEQFIIGSNAAGDFKAPRVRLVCGASEFVFTDLIF